MSSPLQLQLFNSASNAQRENSLSNEARKLELLERRLNAPPDNTDSLTPSGGAGSRAAR